MKINNIINKKEYTRLDELEIVGSAEKWDLRHNACVNPIINKIFEQNYTLHRFIFSDDTSNSFTRFDEMKIPNEFLDHYYTISLKKGSYTEFGSHLNGIMTFPYMSITDFERLEEELGEFWEVYIINPLLMQYSRTLGIFITPKLVHGFSNVYIDEVNNYIQGKTGYKLFFKYSYGECDEITPINWKPSFEEFRKCWKGGDYPLMFDKLINFWYENAEVSCEEFDRTYKRYSDNLSFGFGDGINFKTLESVNPFKLINTRTGWSSAELYKLSFDLHFNLAYTSAGEINFTEEDFNDLKEGNFELKLI